MYQQQINLYKKIHSDQHYIDSLFTWKKFLLANALGFCFYLYLIVAAFYENNVISKENQKKLKLISYVQMEVVKVKSTYPASFFNKDINLSLKEIEANLTTQTKLLDALTNQLLFSNALINIGDVIIDNVWLNDMVISNGGSILKLKGFAISMADFQIFVQNLVNAKIFSGYALNINNIDTSKTSDYISFEISINKKNI